MAKKVPVKRSKARRRKSGLRTAGTRSSQPPPSAHVSATAGPESFRIVGVGASAGGLEAFTDLLRALPANPHMGFVFVQHLDPKHISVLAQLLGRESKMPVVEARDGARVKADHVYVIPRNTSMSIVNGVLALGPREMVAGQFTSIDIFLRSLAKDQGPRAVGVVLSGNASDGALGLKAVKAAGGITFAQEPSSAKYDGMPRAAIAGGCVDFIRRPAEIAQELIRLHQPAGVAAGADWENNDPLPASSAAIQRILTSVRSLSGVDFSHYKESTIKRRIRRRMILRGIDELEKYAALVRGDNQEAQNLYEDILINVTEFFRDQESYRAIVKLVFPRMLQERKDSDRQVRLWVPGCSTGEEAYSLAIVLLEYLGDKAEERPIQLFATDISESALAKARAGIYPASIAQTISPERLRRFFVKSDSAYQINKRVRDFCIFARHNLTKDPPFSRLDLISCRNVLIYLGSVLQERVIPMFHYGLKPNGYLVLGAAESVGPHPDLFQLMDKKNKIYQRRPTAAPARMAGGFSLERVTSERPEPRFKPEVTSEYDIQREADRLVMNKYAPPGVVVDDELNILQFRGQTSQFLAPVSGTASLNLLRMLKEGLAIEVKNAMSKARKENAPVRRDGLRFQNDVSLQTSVEVIPFKRGAGRERRYLILFEPARVEPEAKPRKGKRRSQREVRINEENQDLRRELSGTKEYLQSIIEDQEAAQEELRSASEEIQSSNEELQSTNEELETAKEELQSTNEELNTVNEEMQNRNMQLAQLGSDLVNLLANVNIPILVLGNDLRIRRFTPVAERALNLIAADVGRPIHDINLRIQVPDCEKVLRDVMDNLAARALEVADSEGRKYSLRIRPYRTEDNKIDGLVMVFIDVDPVMRSAGDHVFASVPGHAGLRTSLLLAQEDERRRLAHELHDEVNQKLALLELNVQSLQTRAGNAPPELLRQLEEFRGSVGELSDDLRRVAYQLHPSVVYDLGLVPALQSYCDEFSLREGIQVRFSHHDVPGDLAPMVSFTLYRVVQESLRNVAKHSGAKRANISLTYSAGQLDLTVRDAGTGFHPDATAPGLGMVGMRDRITAIGGTIQWRSKPGEGTQVIATVPIQAEAKGHAST